MCMYVHYVQSFWPLNLEICQASNLEIEDCTENLGKYKMSIQ